MLTSNIKFKNFKKKIKNLRTAKYLKEILNENNEILNSLGKSYNNNFYTKSLNKYKKNFNFRVIGMGGSSLWTKAIYNFLKSKIKKNFQFIDNLQSNNYKKSKKNFTNLVVSKSGNTLETIINANILIKKKDKNIFITENKDSNLNFLAKKLKSEIVHHNNFIGGRYSVLSEVGMLPAELMGLKPENFKRFNYLIKNKNFIDNLLRNVNSIYYFIKQKKI